ncbi:hypothetical protein [Streptomyces bobili]
MHSRHTAPVTLDAHNRDAVTVDVPPPPAADARRASPQAMFRHAGVTGGSAGCRPRGARLLAATGAVIPG